MDYAKLHEDTGWVPTYSFEIGLKGTVQWYLENEKWLEATTGYEFQTCYKTMCAQGET